MTLRRPATPIRWCGIDYGETIMNPLTLHQSAVIREIYGELGRAAEAEERVQRWYRVRATMGPSSTAPHLLVRDLKQYARDRIATEIFDDDKEVLTRYEVKEVMAFAIPESVEGALKLLQSKTVGVAIVSESASVTGVQAISRFLKARAFNQYFQEIITPAGRFSVDGQLVDPTFTGATKKAGTIYEKIREYLKTKGIPSSAAAIIGDDPQLDVEHARPYGFFTVQYTGVIDRGGSEKADFAMKDWKDIGTIL
ncbi:MAG: hypothetical protein A3G76_05265 [Acidobacteria bacterium RIFCSPLOWO2_12_FULL_65_11]|nr:MAG: hypothetical protein A3G76_05265 [Acidobacteria bacterium RIFCSPLOWO2_12_FULL_65_11]